jgi:hypothetical protein
MGVVFVWHGADRFSSLVSPEYQRLLVFMQQRLGDPTLADAILDRVVHNAYKINLSGSSMRKEREKLTTVRPTP